MHCALHRRRSWLQVHLPIPARLATIHDADATVHRIKRLDGVLVAEGVAQEAEALHAQLLEQEGVGIDGEHAAQQVDAPYLPHRMDTSHAHLHATVVQYIKGAHTQLRSRC